MTTGLLLAALAVLLGCARSTVPSAHAGTHGSRPTEKIRLDLSALDEDGLYGPADGLRALHYEFCIPATAAHAAEVRAIDPSVGVLPSSPGRIGCGEGRHLCVGSTHQSDFRRVLLRLARLPYIDRIEPSFAE